MGLMYRPMALNWNCCARFNAVRQAMASKQSFCLEWLQKYMCSLRTSLKSMRAFGNGHSSCFLRISNSDTISFCGHLNSTTVQTFKTLQHTEVPLSLWLNGNSSPWCGKSCVWSRQLISRLMFVSVPCLSGGSCPPPAGGKEVISCYSLRVCGKLLR